MKTVHQLSLSKSPPISAKSFSNNHLGGKKRNGIPLAPGMLIEDNVIQPVVKRNHEKERKNV